jgi:hypothetical protein
MPDMKVTLVPSQNGLDLKMELRQNYADAMVALNDPNYLLLKTIMLEGVFDTIDNTEEKKGEIKKACTMLKQFFALQLTMNYKGLLMQAQGGGMQPPTSGGSPVNATAADEIDAAEAARGTLQDEAIKKVSQKINLQPQEAV